MLTNLGKIEVFQQNASYFLYDHFQNTSKLTWKNEKLQNSWFPDVRILISILDHRTVFILMKLCSRSILHTFFWHCWTKIYNIHLVMTTDTCSKVVISSNFRFCGDVWEVISPSSEGVRSSLMVRWKAEVLYFFVVTSEMCYSTNNSSASCVTMS